MDINQQGAVLTNGWNGGYQDSMLWNGGQGQVLKALSPHFDDTDPNSPIVPTTEAWAMNDLNQAVDASGTAGHEVHAVLWQHSQVVDLHSGIGQGSIARDINNAGQIVVNSTLADNTTRVGMWRNGSLINLGPAAGPAEGLAINAGGAVVGWSALANGKHHAALWNDGLALDLNTLIFSTKGAFT